MKELVKNDEIMAECPRYLICSAPICPLDELKDSRVRLTEDDKCKATKRVRIKIGVKHKLENLGLTNQEASGVKLAYSSLKEYAKTKFNIT